MAAIVRAAMGWRAISGGLAPTSLPRGRRAGDEWFIGRYRHGASRDGKVFMPPFGEHHRADGGLGDPLLARHKAPGGPEAMLSRRGFVRGAAAAMAGAVAAPLVARAAGKDPRVGVMRIAVYRDFAPGQRSGKAGWSGSTSISAS